MSERLDEYLWLAVCGCLCGFIYAFGIGANDVANAFASSVSSKSLTLKQAVIAAGIFEFLGALFLGASVTSTIKDDLVHLDLYEPNPPVLMYGMFTSLFTAMFMLLIATHFGLPVSTTHTIVGTIIGFSIAAEGFDSVDWKGISKIFISWLASPLISGFFGFILFGALRIFVLHREDAYQRAYYTFPVVLFVGFSINVFYILYKGAKNLGSDELGLQVILPSAFGIAIFFSLIWLWPLGPMAKKRVEAGHVVLAHGAGKKMNEADTATDVASGHPHNEELGLEDASGDVDNKVQAAESEDEETEKKNTVVEEKKENEEKAERKSFSSSLRKMSQSFADSTYNQDLHEQSMNENAKAKEIWDNAELYDENAEMMFTYVQVFTACLNSFAHGANDVANAIGPISAILNIYKSGEVSDETGVQKWILAYGGVGIVAGLLLYGYKVMKSVGFKLTMMSPSRGATAELAASLTVVTASFMGIPVSSTQCIVGAVSGVGLTQGVKNVQWLFLGRVCVGWVIIFFTSAVLSAGVFSFGAYAPSLVN